MPPRRFSRRATIAYTAIILAVLLGAGELLSYLYIKSFAVTGTFNDRHVENQFAPVTGWEPTPNVTANTTKPASPHPTYIRVDNEGNSITPLAWDRPDLRIVITGGSTMFGVGQSGNAETVPSLLKRKIHERLGIAAEITNLAVRGYQSFQEAMRLREYLLRHDVDLVVTVSGRNDAMRARIADDIGDGLLPEDDIGPAVRLVRSAELQKPIILHPEGWLREHSYLADLLARVALRLAGDTRIRFGDETQTTTRAEAKAFPRIEPWVNLSLTHYRVMNVVAHSYNAKFLFVLQPTAYSWDAYPGGVAELNGDRPGHDRNRAQENEFYAALRAGVGDLPMIDLSTALDGRRGALYIDNCHYTDEGADILSDAILEKLEPQLRSLMASARNRR